MFAVQNFIETKGVHENNVQIVKCSSRIIHFFMACRQGPWENFDKIKNYFILGFYKSIKSSYHEDLKKKNTFKKSLSFFKREKSNFNILKFI